MKHKIISIVSPIVKIVRKGIVKWKISVHQKCVHQCDLAFPYNDGGTKAECLFYNAFLMFWAALEEEILLKLCNHDL